MLLDWEDGQVRGDPRLPLRVLHRRRRRIRAASESFRFGRSSRHMRHVHRPLQAEVRPRREHEALIHAVFAELDQTKPAGIRYAAFKEPDGVSYVHVAHISGDHEPSRRERGVPRVRREDSRAHRGAAKGHRARRGRRLRAVASASTDSTAPNVDGSPPAEHRARRRVGGVTGSDSLQACISAEPQVTTTWSARWAPGMRRRRRSPALRSRRPRAGRRLIGDEQRVALDERRAITS